jgi:transposase
MTIPGIGPVLAVTIVAEIGEIARFDNRSIHIICSFY